MVFLWVNTADGFWGNRGSGEEVERRRSVLELTVKASLASYIATHMPTWVMENDEDWFIIQQIGFRWGASIDIYI